MGEHAEDHEGEEDRHHHQQRAQALAEQVLADEGDVVHAASSRSMKRPLSRWRMRRANCRLRIVRDHDDGLARFAVEELQDRQDLVGHGAVEVAGRLVAQQQLGVGDDGARDGDALLLPARHLARIVLGAVGKIDDLQRGFDMRAALLRVSLVSSSGSSTFAAVSIGIRL